LEEEDAVLRLRHKLIPEALVRRLILRYLDHVQLKVRPDRQEF
jgi:hypothetical protein